MTRINTDRQDGRQIAIFTDVGTGKRQQTNRQLTDRRTGRQ
jgi:hypothetical protein